MGDSIDEHRLDRVVSKEVLAKPREVRRGPLGVTSHPVRDCSQSVAPGFVNQRWTISTPDSRQKNRAGLPVALQG